MKPEYDYGEVVCVWCAPFVMMALSRVNNVAI